MAAPEFIEEVTFHANHGAIFAYTGARLIGQVSSVEGGIHIKLMGKKFRGHKSPSEEATAINGLAREIGYFRSILDAIIRGFSEAIKKPKPDPDGGSD